MSKIFEFAEPLEYVLRWEKEKPNEVYLTQPLAGGEVETYTWGQVTEQARRGAAYLKSLDLPAGSNIALVGKNSAHWIIADLAIWMAGHVPVPLYPTLGADACTYILEHSEAKLLFVGRLDGVSDSWNELAQVLPETLPLVCLPMSPVVRAENSVLWDQLMRDFEPLQEVILRGREALATIIYTSGTTGRPKGVMHNFRSLTAPAGCSVNLWLPDASDRMLSYLPLAHVAERVAVEIPSLLFGFQLFFNDSLETFPADLKRARPTRFFSVPRLWTKFYQAVNARIPPAKQRILFSIPFLSSKVKKKILQELGLDSVKVGLTGAAPLSAEIISWYRKLGLDLLEVFGMTENCAASHAARMGEVRPGYVGTPLDGVECRIDDTGEVLVKSPGQMMGYYKMPEETKACMTDDGFLRTGDRGELDEMGRLRITGRTKDLFKTSKGKYVAPVPIENMLGAHPGIEVICATGPGQPQPFALAVLSPGALNPSSEEDKNRFAQEFSTHLDEINQQLEDHERLNYVVIVKEPWTIESGLLTPTMKLKRNEIEERYMKFADHWRAQNQKIIWEG
ncbi:AMP-binding protein [Microbulbifer pacificus]|uniref:AMP-binding protein n=1 Tax=Microbulbifer pacificus TaxID=407164 RepID=A0AAU0MXP3_9GAMM|nr:AMP-binding protein [Microbulbifer pacificus]WOX05288.1 AMP-binding protein [Microbulbifer pacificus]